uniref:Protein kinase domain-containing protein n=1 Tax=Trichuris muris TaxID=70415 RepID=A0A5S6QTB6_TRIMR
MRLLLDGHFGVCTLVSRFELATTEYGPNGLPLTPVSINMVGRFSTLKGLCSPYLCAYLDIHRGKYERMFVISEHYLKNIYSLFEEDVDSRQSRFVHVAFSVLSGLDYLHSRGICHTLLSGETVLISENGAVRLSNYGLYYLTNSGRDSPLKRRRDCYSAPELYANCCGKQCIGSKVDLWSLGILLLELLLVQSCRFSRLLLMLVRFYGFPLFDADLTPQLVQLWFSIIREEPVLLSILSWLRKEQRVDREVSSTGNPLWPSEFHSLVNKCLQLKPSHRSSASELLMETMFERYEEEVTPIMLDKIFLDSSLSMVGQSRAQLSDDLISRYINEPFRLRPIDEVYFIWTLCGSKAEAVLIKENLIEELPPILCLPDFVIGDLDLLGGLKSRRGVANLSIYPLSMKNLSEKMKTVNPLMHFPLLETELQSFPRSDRTAESLPLLVKEKDVSYQLKRTALFRRLLAAYPYTRNKLISEAVFDIPPIYRGLVWAAILDVSYNISDVYSAIDKETEVATDRQIEVDIPRCHQYDELLSSPAAHEKFKRIIKAWTAYHPQYVYWQGLDSLCAPFLYLHFNNECLAFGCLTSFVNSFLKDFFLKDNSAVMREYLAVFETALAFYDSQLYNHLSKINFHPELYAIPWFLTMFAHVMPLYKLFHVWDLLLVSGNCFPICIGVAILSQMRHLLLQSGFNECILVFSDIPEINLENCLKKAISAYRTIPKSLLYNRRLSAVLSNCATWIDDYVLKVDGELGLKIGKKTREDEEENGLFPEICADELLYYLNRDDIDSSTFLLIDVRSAEEFARKAFPRSQNVPYTVVFKEGSARDCRARRFAAALIDFNYSRVCVLHGGIEVIRYYSVHGTSLRRLQ